MTHGYAQSPSKAFNACGLSHAISHAAAFQHHNISAVLKGALKGLPGTARAVGVDAGVAPRVCSGSPAQRSNETACLHVAMLTLVTHVPVQCAGGCFQPDARQVVIQGLQDGRW